MMNQWCDIGVNLFSSQFDTDRDDILHRAAAAGVTQLILIGSDIEESQQNITFCRQHPGCFTTAGIHPHQAGVAKSGYLPALATLIQSPHVIAVGECGLDFNRDFSPRPLQQKLFSEQLQLAKEMAKPVYLHQRDAFDTQQAILKESHINRGVSHCFTGDTAQLKAWLDLGLHIGITGWLCDERRSEELRQALQYIPLDRLLLETDAPYLLPRDMTPKPASRRNEPAFLTHIAATVARMLQLDIAELARQTVDNSRNLFQLDGQLQVTGEQHE